MAVYNIHGGHNPAGKIACGASDLLDESKEDRKIAKAIIKYLKKAGATTYNCSVSNGKSQNDVLKKICAKLLNIDYIRFERKSLIEEIDYDNKFIVDTIEEACEIANKIGTNIFIGTGSKI